MFAVWKCVSSFFHIKMVILQVADETQQQVLFSQVASLTLQMKKMHAEMKKWEVSNVHWKQIRVINLFMLP